MQCLAGCTESMWYFFNTNKKVFYFFYRIQVSKKLCSGHTNVIHIKTIFYNLQIINRNAFYSSVYRSSLDNCDLLQGLTNHKKSRSLVHSETKHVPMLRSHNSGVICETHWLSGPFCSMHKNLYVFLCKRKRLNNMLKTLGATSQSFSHRDEQAPRICACHITIMTKLIAYKDN